MRRMKILANSALLLLLCGAAHVMAQLSAQDQALFNAVTSAYLNNNLETIKDALRNGANLEAKNNEGDTPLSVAAACCTSDIVKLLLENHANIEARDKFGETPLFWAAYEGKTDNVKVLLDNHADTEAKNKDGLTPLLIAAYAGHADIAKLLLEYHANRLAKTNSGETAIDMAAKQRSCDIVVMLAPDAPDSVNACLTALIAYYQAHPTYSDLPDVAIRTVVAMNPRPGIPEEARQSYVQANVTYRNAQGDADIKSAIALYKDALMKAPWFSDAWYNLSLAQEKLGDYAGAANSMKTMEPLEAGGPNERRDLDRMYALEARAK